MMWVPWVSQQKRLSWTWGKQTEQDDLGGIGKVIKLEIVLGSADERDRGAGEGQARDMQLHREHTFLPLDLLKGHQAGMLHCTIPGPIHPRNCAMLVYWVYGLQPCCPRGKCDKDCALTLPACPNLLPCGVMRPTRCLRDEMCPVQEGLLPWFYHVLNTWQIILLSQ
jgi:hypothetical protein